MTFWQTVQNKSPKKSLYLSAVKTVCPKFDSFEKWEMSAVFILDHFNWKKEEARKLHWTVFHFTLK